MRTELVTPPEVEPITLAEAKRHLRDPPDVDDDVIGGFVIAARQMVENELRRAIITQTWDLYLDGWPYGGGYFNRSIREQGPGFGWLPSNGGVPIQLDRPRLQSIESITYVDEAGVTQTLPTSAYDVSPGTPGRVQAKSGTTWPTTRNQMDAVRIRYVCGYGDPEDVPKCVLVGIKLLLSHLYENRGEEDIPMPTFVKHVLAPEDWGSYS